MSRTERFRQQHNELMGLATELRGLLNPAALAQDGSAARSCVSKLTGKLTLHLGTEDKVLYPELMSHKDATVAAMAKRFANEMASTAPVVVAYSQKWGTATAIKQDPAGFVKESKTIITTLADRIKRENTELYAAADRCEGRAF